jgi:hypothetical protein
MRRIILSSASFVVSAFALSALTGCVGDDTEVPVPDSGTVVTPLDGGHDATVGGEEGGPGDAALDTGDTSTVGNEDASDGATGPGFLVLSYALDEFSKSEADAIDLSTGLTAGHFSYAQGGTNVVTPTGPWVLEQFNDVIAKMDPAQPWLPVSTWDVSSAAPEAGGYAYGDAMSVAETGSKAYVALFNRNHVPVLDTTAKVDGGAPTTSVDLSALLQATDDDGSVDDVAAVYDDSQKRVWLVLGNIDETTVTAPTYDLLCKPGLASTVVAIDATDDKLVAGLTYTLAGVDPGSVVYDAPNERLIIMSSGCNRPPDAGSDAGPGALVGRLIEQIDLKSGMSTVLYDANSQGFPGQLVYVNEHQAFVSFGFTGSSSVFGWDPTSTSLGASLTNAPDAFVWDGKGLLGPRTSYLSDGGIAIEVIDVNPLTGEATNIVANPVSAADPSAYLEGIDLWRP